MDKEPNMDVDLAAISQDELVEGYIENAASARVVVDEMMGAEEDFD